jgi:hypothetical protein
MKSYFVKLGGRHEGPYSETQIAQMFADGRVDRSTPCKTDQLGDWKTIDDYLPMLKYGTQLPLPSASRPDVQMHRKSVGSSVAITDIDVPFGSILKMVFKTFAAWLIVIVCFTPVILIVWFIVFAIIAALVGHSLSVPHSP